MEFKVINYFLVRLQLKLVWICYITRIIILSFSLFSRAIAPERRNIFVFSKQISSHVRII